MKKIVALVTAITFSFSGHSTYAAPFPQMETAADLPAGQWINPLTISFPPPIGEIKEKFEGQNKRLVVLIQDAHAIPDAQKNIRHLIEYSEKNYQIPLVALEGSASGMDSFLFKTFPDQKLLRKVLEDYFEKGELAGGTAAAILNNSSSLYHGIEEWSLYEEGLRDFLNAMAHEQDINSELASRVQELREDKARTYSKNLLALDQELEKFRENIADFISTLKALAAVKPPEKNSHLALLLEESVREEGNDSILGIEIQKAASFIRQNLEKTHSEESRKDLRTFHEQSQNFKTSHISAQDFALFLKELSKKHHIRVRVSSKLNQLTVRQKRIKDIEGTKLFEDFEKYSQSVKETLFNSLEERHLDQRSHQIDLLTRLQKLELSPKDWAEIKNLTAEAGYWDIRFDRVNEGQDISSLLSNMKPNLDFYQNAEKRTQSFLKQTVRLMLKDKTQTAVLVAGGFHAEGLTELFRSEGISYVLVMPKIAQIPENIHYREHMRGEVSWNRYFQVQNGQVNLYNAFVRGTRDRLLELSSENPNGVLKAWRDNIILTLAKEGRVKESRQYTKFIDEIRSAPGSAGGGDLALRWKKNIDQFIKNLRKLHDQNEITEENISKLFQTGLIPPAPDAPVVLSPGIKLSAELIPQLKFSKKNQNRNIFPSTQRRSEMRRTGTASSRTVHENILNDFLENPDLKSTLFYTQEANALDRYLLGHSKKEKLNYVRVSLRSRADLARLISDLRTAADGKGLKNVPGELWNALENGGILLIDYAGSTPALAEEFNSLFDKNAYFQELKKIFPDLKIIGAMKPEQNNGYTNALQSRYNRTYLFEFENPPQNPLAPIFEMVNDEDELPGDAVVIDLFDGDPFDTSLPRPLVSGVRIDAQGRMTLEEGDLARAVKSGKPIVIRRGNFKEGSSLMQFLTRAAVLGFQIDGEPYTLPLKIYGIPHESPENQKIAEEKKLITPEEAQEGSPENVWTLNSTNAASLFDRLQIDSEGRIVPLTPMLKIPGVRIRVTGNLPLSIWHRLMESPEIVQIEIAPNVHVPAPYRSQRSQNLVKSSNQASSQEQTWEEAAPQKVIYVETSDLGITAESLRQKFGGTSIFSWNVNPDDTVTHITGEVEEIEPGIYRHTGESNGTEILEALTRGETVFITGLDSNAALAEDLSTLNAPEPYLVINGERRFLKDFPGRIILAFAPSMKQNRPAKRVVEDGSGEKLKSVLEQEFKEELTEERWEQINRLKEALAKNFPDVSLNWGLNRMRLLLRQVRRSGGDWESALQDVIGNHFQEDREKRAFVRLLIRYVFKIEGKNRKPNTAAWERLREIMEEKMIEPLTWDHFGWEIADALSLDLILKIWDKETPNLAQGPSRAFSAVKQALDPAKPAAAPSLDLEFEKDLDIQERQLDKVYQILKNERAAMIIGIPGVGKSYSADQLAKRLGYSKEQVIKLTVGAGIKADDLKGNKEFQRKGLEDWANSKNGGLLLIDEANLTDPDFWNFLRGFLSGQLTENHRILFTGNPYSMPGRQLQKLLQEFVITVPYEEFSPKFLREWVETNLDPATPEREARAELIYEIYTAVRKVPGMSSELSLRDLSELTERVNTLLEPEERTRENILWTAWRQFRGMLTVEQREALRLYLHTTLGGTDLNLKEREETFPEGKDFELTVMTESTGRFLNGIEDALTMRDANIRKAAQARGKGTLYENKGKSGLIAEGPSGRLKSEGIVTVLKSRGFAEAEEAPANWPANKKYYRVTASPGSAQQLIEQIRKAQREGAVVVIDELNLLPSNFLEGILNDVLTGAAEPGFFLFASMNTADFEGRQKLSSALQNRVIYQRLEPYWQSELAEIAKKDLSPGKSKKAAEGLANRLARFQVWLQRKIEAPSRRPTVRELRAAAQAIAQGKTFEEAVESVYGTRFFELLRPDGKTEIPASVFSDSPYPAANEAGQDLLKTIQIFAAMFFPEEMKLPRIEVIESPTKGGSRISLTHTIRINRNRLYGEDEWLEILLHEISHGLFTTEGGLLGAGDAIWQDLEDIRHQRAFERLFPNGKLGNVPLQDRLERPSSSEEEFAEMIRKRNYSAFKNIILKTSVSPRQIFQLILTVSARELVTDQQLQGFLTGLTENEPDVLTLLPVNPFSEALPFTQAARNYVKFVPHKGASRSEIESFFKQALAQLDGIENAAARLSSDPVLEAEAGEKKPALNQNPSAYRQPPANLHNLIAKGLQQHIEKARVQLNEIKDDLESPEGVTKERLEEILGQLTNPNHPYSLVRELETLKDDGLTQLKRAVLEIIKNRARSQTALPGKPSYFNSLLDSLIAGLIGLATRTQGPEIGPAKKKPRPPEAAPPSPRKARYASSGHGAHGDQTKEEAPVIIEATGQVAENAAVPTAGLNLPARDPILHEVTRQDESEDAFLNILQKLFFNQNLPEGDFGARGEFKIEQFLRTHQISQSHYYLNPNEANLVPRPFVLRLEGPGDFNGNPLIFEFFHYLFERGFSVTVYFNDKRRQVHIRDFKTLTAALFQSQPVPEEVIRQDYKNRGETAPPIFSISQLQAMVEGEVYLAGILRKTARGEVIAAPSGTQIPPEKSGAESAPAQTQESSEVRKTRIEARLRDLIDRKMLPESTQYKVSIRDNLVEVSFSGNKFFDDPQWKLALQAAEGVDNLDLTGTHIGDLSPIPRTVKKLVLSSAALIYHWEPLKNLPLLEELDLSFSMFKDLNLLPPGLKKLYLAGGISITDGWAPIKNLSQLEVLHVGSADLQDEDLHFLPASLKKLNIRNNPEIKNWTPLKSLTQLEILDLMNNKAPEEDLFELSPDQTKGFQLIGTNGKLKGRWQFKQTPAEERLARIKDNIEKMIGKKILARDQVPVIRLFKGRVQVHLSKIFKIPEAWETVLKALEGVDELVLSDTNIIDLSSIPASVKKLSLWNSKNVPDWTPLRELPHLEQLSLRGTPFSVTILLEPSLDPAKGFQLLDTQEDPTVRWQFKKTPRERGDQIKARLKKLVDRKVLSSTQVPKVKSLNGEFEVWVEFYELSVTPEVWKSIFETITDVDGLYFYNTNISDLSAIPVDTKKLLLINSQNIRDWTPLKKLAHLQEINLNGTRFPEGDLFEPSPDTTTGFLIRGTDGNLKDGRWRVKTPPHFEKQPGAEIQFELFSQLKILEPSLQDPARAYSAALNRLDREGYGDFVRAFKEQYQARFQKPVPGSTGETTASARSEARTAIADSAAETAGVVVDKLNPESRGRPEPADLREIYTRSLSDLDKFELDIREDLRKKVSSAGINSLEAIMDFSEKLLAKMPSKPMTLAVNFSKSGKRPSFFNELLRSILKTSSGAELFLDSSSYHEVSRQMNPQTRQKAALRKLKPDTMTAGIQVTAYQDLPAIPIAVDRAAASLHETFQGLFLDSNGVNKDQDTLYASEVLFAALLIRLGSISLEKGDELKKRLQGISKPSKRAQIRADYLKAELIKAIQEAGYNKIDPGAFESNQGIISILANSLIASITAEFQARSKFAEAA